MKPADALPQLSIIVPLLNERQQLTSLINHAKEWRDKGCEIILVDGGSTDGSLSVLQESGLKTLSAPRGRAHQMNAGAAVAEGDMLLFLHADTRLCEGAHTLVREALARSNSGWGRFDVRIDGDHWLLKIVGGLMNLRSRLTGVATGDQCLFLSATTFQAVGGFPKQPLMEDIEISRRLLRLSRPICLRRKITTSGRRWLDNGIGRTIWLMWRLRWAYWRGTSAEQLARYYR